MNARCIFGFLNLFFVFASFASGGELLKLATGSIDPLKHETQLRSSPQSHELVIQFKNKISMQDQAWLMGQGAKILRYLPDDAYIIHYQGAEELLSANPRVRSVTNFESRFKISPDIQETRTPQNFYRVAFWNEDDRANFEQNIQRLIPLGVGLQKLGHRSIVVYSTIQNLETIAGIEGVEYVQPVLQMRTMVFDVGAGARAITYGSGDYSDITGGESGTKILNLDKAYQAGLTGKGQIVGVADTGLDSGDANSLIADIKGNFLKGEIFGQGSTSWEDSNGHGTHVSGSIVGTGNISQSKIRGAAYDAKLVMQSLWNSLMTTLNLPQDLGDLFTPAYNDGARIHSNSWGSTSGFGAYDGNAQEVDDFVFKHQDMLILFAAGNNGVDKNADGRIDENNISSPGTAKNVLTVGASENIELTRSRQTGKDFANWQQRWPVDPIASGKISDNQNGVALFSSRGPTADGRIKPEIIAPGTNILSLHSQIPGAALWGNYNDFYAWAGGTSMATPLTAGVALLTRQFLIEKMQIANPSAALMKAILTLTAQDIYPGQYGENVPAQEIKTRRPEVNEGFGRVDMNSVMDLAQNGGFIDEKVGVGTDEEKSYSITVPQDSFLEVELAYVDAPGSPSSQAALVNDLDLSLSGAPGQVLQKTDRVNNFEYIHQLVKPGNFTLKVRGFKVPLGINGKQPFAIVYRWLRP